MAESTRAHAKTCAQCGTPFTARRSDARFCSQRCSCRYRAGKMHRRSCQECGTDISDRMGNARYCPPCSAERAAKVHGRSPALIRCASCGTEFTNRTGREKFCTRTCSGRAARARQLDTPLSMTCPACGERFQTFDVRTVACSTACKQWVRKHPGVPRLVDGQCETCGETFRAGRKRDGWICQLCHRRISKRLRHPHPLSASLDHVIPLSRGGRHCASNVQAAHLGCNVSKGNRGGNEQLMLIG